MYHSNHAYQSTKNIEDFRLQSEYGLNYTYHQARINNIFSLDMLSLKDKYINASANASHKRERESERERERERERENKDGQREKQRPMERETKTSGERNKDWQRERERVQGDILNMPPHFCN